MKKLLSLTFAITLFALSSPSFSAIVKAARMDQTGEKILVDVTYTGGCKPHTFKFEKYGCYETHPPLLCIAGVLDETADDSCEMKVNETLAFALKDYSLELADFFGATIRIFGDKKPTGEVSEVEVVLPN